MLFRTCGKSYEKIDTSVEIIKHVKFTYLDLKMVSKSKILQMSKNIFFHNIMNTCCCTNRCTYHITYSSLIINTGAIQLSYPKHHIYYYVL